MGTAKVITSVGEINVPAFFNDKVNDLCVTMTNFGTFDVTHRKTGRKLVGGYERASSAIASMIEFHIAFKEADIDLSLNMHDIFKLAVDKKDTKHKCLGDVSIVEAVNLHNSTFAVSGEFPWESFDESPFGRIEELEKLL